MNRWLAAFPKRYEQDVRIVKACLPFGWTRLSPGAIEVNVEQEQIQIPMRVYMPEVASERIEQLTPTQQTMLYCLYTRHHDGYVREHYLQQLLKNRPRDGWVLAYIIELASEYVREIVDSIVPVIEQWDSEVKRQFVEDDPRYMKRTEDRMISYWNAYYRTSGERRSEADYPGFRIIESLREDASVEEV
ncbi:MULTISPECIES: hypothetical protein [Exiguobacterium]|uniref:hypothetical protein n=1 Tax=Exiguobacterium TaxID=33986 RepID=UPI0006492878|nr:MULTISPECIES: hypothetical protein [unclassified Exiguobacterium]AOS99313.1 hypothetical protein ESP131_03160 [Exiguobacterium sp. U13-1]